MKGATPLATEYRRDLLGRIVRVVDPALNQWTYTFDGLGRRIAVNDPDLGQWSYAYDAGSRLIQQTDAKGQLTSLGYDALGRVTAKTVTGPSIVPEVTANAYDEPRAGYFNLGKLTTAARDGISRRFDHDAAGRLAQETHVGVQGQDRLPSATGPLPLPQSGGRGR